MTEEEGTGAALRAAHAHTGPHRPAWKPPRSARPAHTAPCLPPEEACKHHGEELNQAQVKDDCKH